MIKLFILLKSTLLVLISYVILQFHQPAAAKRFNPYVYTLSNGLTVILLENHKAPLVKVQLWYKAGSREDPEGKSGIAHFMEHLMFRCRTDQLEPKQYENEIRAMGGTHNAFTSYDMTSYFAIVPSRYMERVLQLEASRMAKFELDPETVDQEREVILSERKMMIDKNPSRSFGELVNATFRLHDRGKLPVIGWRHEMENLTLSDAKDFHKKWYKPNNAILIISGNINKDETMSMVKKYFAPIKKGYTPRRFILQEPEIKNFHIRVEKSDPEIVTPVIDYIYSVRSIGGKVSIGIKDLYAIKIMTSILNRPDNFLYQELIKKNKLSNDVNVGYYGMTLNMGVFYISAELGRGKELSALERKIDQFIEYIKSHPITAEQLEREKKELLRSLKFENDYIFAGSEAIGRTLSIGLPIDYVEDIETIISNITIGDINRNIDAIFKHNNKKIAILKPTSTGISSDTTNNISNKTKIHNNT